MARGNFILYSEKDMAKVYYKYDKDNFVLRIDDYFEETEISDFLTIFYEVEE